MALTKTKNPAENSKLFKSQEKWKRESTRDIYFKDSTENRFSLINVLNM